MSTSMAAIVAAGMTMSTQLIASMVMIVATGMSTITLTNTIIMRTIAAAGTSTSTITLTNTIIMRTIVAAGTIMFTNITTMIMRNLIYVVTSMILISLPQTSSEPTS